MGATPLLIGDIGGTNARFALADEATQSFADAVTLRCADFDSADSAIRHYLKTVNAQSPAVICLAAAGPIIDQQVRFTNNDWRIAAGELASLFSTPAVRLLNDFEAIAYCIPLLAAPDCRPVGLPDPPPLPVDRYTVGIVGPGTGLGAVGLLRRSDRFLAIAGEASHGGFAPESQVQIDVLKALRERFDRVSTERLVSGPGIENVYWALTRIHNENRARLSAAEIFAAGNDNSDPRAAEAVHLFFEMLGQFAGDYALALGATDGIYIAGGIVRRYPELLSTSRFRNGFENKGRYRSIMERIPTQLIVHPEPGLLGASHCAREMQAAGVH